jgi:hypothetical protein
MTDIFWPCLRTATLASWMILYYLERRKSKRLEYSLKNKEAMAECQDVLIRNLREQILEIRNGFRVSESVSDRDMGVYIKCHCCGGDLWDIQEEGVLNSLFPPRLRLTCKNCESVKFRDALESPDRIILMNLDLVIGQSCYKLPIGTMDVLSVRVGMDNLENISDCEILTRMSEYEYAEAAKVSCVGKTTSFCIDSVFNVIHFWPIPNRHRVSYLEIKRG